MILKDSRLLTREQRWGSKYAPLGFLEYLFFFAIRAKLRKRPTPVPCGLWRRHEGRASTVCPQNEAAASLSTRWTSERREVVGTRCGMSLLTCIRSAPSYIGASYCLRYEETQLDKTPHIGDRRLIATGP